MIGCLILPVAVQLNERLSLGASVDLAYGSLTVQQAMPIWAIMDMMLPPLRTLGVATVRRLSPIAIGRMLGTGLLSYGHLDFENFDNWGYGGQLGLPFRRRRVHAQPRRQAQSQLQIRQESNIQSLPAALG
jgi:long-subunit fatty acid transport protein